MVGHEQHDLARDLRRIRGKGAIQLSETSRPRQRGLSRLASLLAAGTLVASSTAFFGSIVLAAGGTPAPGPGDVACGYPDASNGARSASVFTESTVFRAIQIIGSGASAKLAAWANDENSVILGVNGATEWSSAGSVTPGSSTLSAALVANTNITSLPIAPLTGTVLAGDSINLVSGAKHVTYTAAAPGANPGDTSIPVVSKKPGFAYPIGTTVTDTTVAGGPHTFSSPSLGDLTSTDAVTGGNGLLWFPALYVTDITAGNVTGKDAPNDWQQGTPADKSAPSSSKATTHIDDVFGTWVTATVTGTTYTRGALPPKNDWNLGPGSDTPSAGFAALGNEGYGFEARWNVSGLTDQNNQALQAGHIYKFQVTDHDGDQNKGGDSGENCAIFTFPGPPVINTVPNVGPGNPNNDAHIRVTIGSTLTDSVTITGTPGFGNVTGKVTFNLYFVPAGTTPDPATACTTTPVFTQDQTLIPGTPPPIKSTATTSPGYVASALGTYFWEDIYTPDASSQYTTVSELCGVETANTVDAHILLTPHAAANSVGTAHTLTATVETTKLDGTYGDAVSGALVIFTFVNNTTPAATFVGAPPPLDRCTTGAAGTCTVQINDNTSGGVSVHASAANFSQAGPPAVIGTFTRSTDGSGTNSTDAGKTYVDGAISITPASAINVVNHAHTLTATVVSTTDKFATTDPVDGAHVVFTFVGATSAIFVGGTDNCDTDSTGTCTVQINDAVVETVTIHAASTFTPSTPAGVVGTLTRETDNTGHNSDNAIKIYINPKTQLTVFDTLIGLPASATGTLTYNVYDNNTCADPAGPTGLLQTSSGTVTAGVATDSSTFVVTPGHQVWFTATFAGTIGGVNNPFTTSCSVETASS
jgi:hypothetical protein